MLLILPMLGINAFTPSKQKDVNDQVQPVGSDGDKFDTIVVLARDEGFQQRFLNENCWFAVRINIKHIKKKPQPRTVGVSILVVENLHLKNQHLKAFRVF